MTASDPFAPGEPVVLDLDGVLWRGDEGIPGAAEAVAALVRRGHPLAFVTNMSALTVAAQEDKLRSFGVDPPPGSVVTSAVAVASLVHPGERVLYAGGPGLFEALGAAGAEVVRNEGVDAGTFDVVVVGLDRDFDYQRLRVASTAVRDGARLLASNDDATYPVPGGLVPGCGALVAAVERAAGVRAVVAGKPYPPMVDLIRSRLGDGGVVVGDRDDTDGAFARALGWRFTLVLSGVTVAVEGLAVTPDVVATSLSALVTGGT